MQTNETIRQYGTIVQIVIWWNTATPGLPVGNNMSTEGQIIVEEEEGAAYGENETH